MHKLISDLRNMVASSRHTGEPIDTERVSAAIAAYHAPDYGLINAIHEARARWYGVWPEDLTSGVMFCRGFRITREQFETAGET